MASKRRLRREKEQAIKKIDCREKIKHPDVVAAYQHAKSLHELDGGVMNWYRCRACGNLHVGHA